MGSARNSANSSVKKRRSSVAESAKIASYRARMMSLRKSPRRKAEMDKPAPKKVVDKKKAAVKAPLPLEPEREKLAKNGFQKSSKKTPVVKIPRPRGRPRRATIESRHVIKKEPKTSKKKKAVEPSPNRSSSEELEAPSTKFVALDPVEKEEFLKQPLVVEQPPEEDDDEKTLSSVSSVTTSDGELEDERMFGSEEHLTPMAEPMMAGTPEGSHDFDMTSPLGGPNQPPPSATPDASDASGNASKKSTTRRNAWGNMSYADLITQAIMSSPEKKLTLSQVYEWMVQNVPYFRDKGDSNSSAGWKNSIRHNLSLHNRFMRIQNEGAGKSSWWVINPDAKPGRNPRRPRAATLDNTSKHFQASMERKKRGAKKRIDMPGNIRGPGLQGNSLVGSQASILSHDPYDDEPMSSFNEFRPRTQSTISIPATGSRVSPNMEQSFEDFDFPPWVDTAAQAAVAQAAVNAPHVNELLDRTGQIRLADTGVTDNSFPRMINGQQLNGIKTSPTQMPVVKQEPVTNGGIKTEINGVHPPPSYHELNSVRANSQLQQNPLLRTQLHSALGLAGTKLTAPPGVGVGFPCFTTPMYSAAGLVGCPTTMLPTVWPPSSSTATIMTQNISCGQSAGLPTDLENLNLPDHSLMDLDMESLLRHELELSQNEKLGFD